jgi:hypothetical protein
MKSGHIFQRASHRAALLVDAAHLPFARQSNVECDRVIKNGTRAQMRRWQRNRKKNG